MINSYQQVEVVKDVRLLSRQPEDGVIMLKEFRKIKHLLSSLKTVSGEDLLQHQEHVMILLDIKDLVHSLQVSQ